MQHYNIIISYKQGAARDFFLMLLTLLIMILTSCKKFVEIDTPRTDLVRTTVFTSDATANAAVSDIYYQMISGSFAQGGISSVTFITSLSSDELQNYNTGSSGQEYQQFNENQLLPTNNKLLSLWSEPYQYIYKANAIIEGLNSSTGVSEALKKQLIGEAKFIRAFSHFYLVNMFGDIPLVITTNYKANTIIPRTPKAEVYQQIILDLKDAQNLLIDNYSFSNNERVRPNKSSATTLLGRAYLYIEDWANAEAQATAVISNTTLYSLVQNLDDVFLANSKEAIWQLLSASADIGINTWEAYTFVFVSIPTQAALTPQFVNGFETGDVRKGKWVGVETDGTNTYYYPFKYKIIGPSNPPQEYSMVLRLSELYLIRSEARAKQNNISGSQADINSIRNRANLGNTTASTQASLLAAIEQERKVELFTEWGHRWLDLKRTGRADAVLGLIKTGWEPTDVLYPIPQSQILGDPAMANAQNPGY